ncbi:hypothetical protein [Corynebacterium aurimucosum]|uniref:hypothetical protein n=1 Tax=Corynebacterium aurimucosum TaxID=169292 RepID=UPI00187AEC82|nr:hypothetical protein [Corynebacterium aurimucosum]MBE7338123.1 hypothetical protein [Corynebacterium aurimucosum]
MTTSDKPTVVIHANFFHTFANAPGLREKLHEVAEEIVDNMKAGWPKSIGDRLTDDSPNFQHTGHEKVFEVVSLTSQDGRPVELININHPYAVEHQARTGGFTRAVTAAGFDIAAQGGE